jgi:hypothetical protein
MKLGTVAHLPTRLVRLRLSQVDSAAKFTRADFALLPQTLSSIEFNMGNIQDRDTFKGLPISIETIFISIPLDVSSKLISDVTLLDNLPSSLKSLTLFQYSMKTAWTEWMCRLDRFKALDTLIVSLNDTSPLKPSICLDFISSLPDTIVKLTLPLNKSHITREQMENLPESLTDFWLTSTKHDGPNFASDECFAVMPKRLASLYLPNDLHGLTPNIINILPSTLACLRLPTTLFQLPIPGIHLLKKKYHAREALEWGEYIPP